jgi:hypothetical protein
MKQIVLMSLVIVGVLCAGPLAALDTKGPRIEVKELRHDFGKIVQGTQVAYVFEVKNAGSEQLVIEKIQSS